MSTKQINSKERGKAWRNRRLSMGRSQVAVAKEIGVSPSVLCNWEYGSGKLNPAQQAALAKALGYRSASALMAAHPDDEERTANVPLFEPLDGPLYFERTFLPAEYGQPPADPPVVEVNLRQGDTLVSVKIPGKLVDVFARVLAGGS